MALSRQQRIEKLRRLADIEGYTTLDELFTAIERRILPGICTNPGCDFTKAVAPSETAGYCPRCGTHTVVSGSALLGLS